MKLSNKIFLDWKFWIVFQLALVAALFVIGVIRAGNGLLFLFRPAETAIEVFGTVLGVASGIIFLFKDSMVGILGSSGDPLLYIIILPFLYYGIFFSAVRYIVRSKKFYKIIIFALIVMMLLSFSGCSRVIQTGAVYT